MMRKGQLKKIFTFAMTNENDGKNVMRTRKKTSLYAKIFEKQKIRVHEKKNVNAAENAGRKRARERMRKR